MARVIRHIRTTITTEVWVLTWNNGECSATSPPSQIAHTVCEWIEKQDVPVETSSSDNNPDENSSFGNNTQNSIS